MNILGGSPSTLQLASKPPTVIMLVGLKGSGKTTTAAKLALHLRKSGAKPILVAADPYRMAAGEQLKSLGKQLGMPVFEADEGQNAARPLHRVAEGSDSGRARPSSSSTRRAARRSTAR